MKKLIPLLLALVLVLSFGLSGCGKDNGPAANTASDESSAAPVTIDPFGKYDPVVEINTARTTGTDDKFLPGESWDNNVWTREFESELGIKVSAKWEAQGWDAYNTKLNLGIASRDLPDFFKVTSAAQLQRLVTGNLIEDLTSVYADWNSPYVKEQMALGEGKAEAQCTLNGKLYAFPTGPIFPAQESYTFVRDDIRLELGKEEPKTMEDLIDLGKAMVAAGKTQYAFAFGNNPFEGYMGMLGFFNAYDAYPRNWIEKDGQIVYGGIQPEMKTALGALKQAYADKLIDPEFVVKDNYTASQDAVAGKAGICFGQFWLATWPLPDAYKADNKVEWATYPILFSTSAVNKKVQGVAIAIDINASTYAVKKGYAHPEALMKMHNYFVEKLYGPDSDQNKYHSSGEVGIFGKSPMQGTNGIQNNPLTYKAVTAAIDGKDESLVTNPMDKKQYDMVKAFFDGNTAVENHTSKILFYGPRSVFAVQTGYYDNKTIMTNAFFGADTPEMLRKMSVLQTNETDIILKSITGEKADADFDTFVTDWNNLGGELITAEVNAWKRDLGAN